MPAPFIAAGVGIARALPYLYRGAKAAPNIIRAGLNYFKPYQMSAGVKASGNQIIQSGKYAGQKFKDVYPNLYKKGNMPKFNITSTSKSNIALQTPFYAGAAMQGYDYLTDEAEQSVANGQRTVPSPATSGGPAGMTIEEGKATGIIKDKKEQPKDDVKITSDQIKSGELDDFIKERIDLFKKYIGDDTRKRTKTAGYNAMVQFGLNLATKRGNLVEGIAESAKEPLKEFAKLGNDLMDRAASIEKAGIESGVSAYEKAEDRKIDEKAIEADILQEKIKQQARTLSRGEFITTTKTDIMGNEKLFNAITASRYDKDGNLIENAPSEEALIDQYAENLYNTYRAVELPPGQAGADLLETLPSGTMYYNPETGEYAYKQ
jgi:hypothetical protein